MIGSFLDFYIIYISSSVKKERSSRTFVRLFYFLFFAIFSLLTRAKNVLCSI